MTNFWNDSRDNINAAANEIGDRTVSFKEAAAIAKRHGCVVYPTPERCLRELPPPPVGTRYYELDKDDQLDMWRSTIKVSKE